MNDKVYMVLMILVICSAILVASAYASSVDQISTSSSANSHNHGHQVKTFDPNNFKMHSWGISVMDPILKSIHILTS